MTFEQLMPGRPSGTMPFPELRAGNLGVRVADSAAEIDAVQALRYRVFYQEMGARPTRPPRQPARPRYFRRRSPTICWWSTTRSGRAGGRGRHLPADPARGRGAAGPLLLRPTSTTSRRS